MTLRGLQYVTRFKAPTRAILQSRKVSSLFQPDKDKELQQLLVPVCEQNQRLAKLELEWIKEHAAHENSTEKFEQLVQKWIKNIERARKVHPLLPKLLGACGDLSSAQRELQWMKEHVEQKNPDGVVGLQGLGNDDRFEAMCDKRREGVPLQYLLGSEYFGDMKLRCEEGVLIPRQDTANQVTHLLDLLNSNGAVPPKTLRVLDLCSGSGCTSLLFAHSLHYQRSGNHDWAPHVEILGVDMSTAALSNAEANRSALLNHLQATNPSHPATSTLQDQRYVRADILNKSNETLNSDIPPISSAIGSRPWDIILSNPPYISPKDFQITTARSVRLFEPVSALVPPGDARGDTFYPRILQVARDVDAKIVLVEVGDIEQARRVASMAIAKTWWDGVEIWRDEPSGDAVDSKGDADEVEVVRGNNVRTIGRGHGRSVVCWRGDGATWLGRGYEHVD